MLVQISWFLLKKPIDLDLHCLQRQGMGSAGLGLTWSCEVFDLYLQVSGHGQWLWINLWTNIYNHINEPGTAFPTRLHKWPAKTKISPCIRAVYSKSLHGILRVAQGPKCPVAGGANSDLTAQVDLSLHFAQIQSCRKYCAMIKHEFVSLKDHMRFWINCLQLSYSLQMPNFP